MEKTFQEIPLADIQPSPMNPRKTFEWLQLIYQTNKLACWFNRPSMTLL